MTDTGSSNPFLISRVDNPFQQHPDVKKLHENEFNILCSAIKSIKTDPNYQSRAITITGAPGSGKTHIAMRLANEILESNRLLFIRQPNNSLSVYHHIYSRILESMVEKVPNTRYSQLAYLLGKSFSGILIETISNKTSLTAKDKSILEILKADPINILKKIGGPGTETRRRNWKYVQNKTLQWWESNYGLAQFTPDILKAFIKYCSYTDAKRKHLVYRWLSCSELSESESNYIGLPCHSENINKEEFALNAMIVISKLSIADEPLVIIFDQLEGLKYDEELLFKFFEAVKELFTHIKNSLFIFNMFTDRWQKWQYQLDASITDRLSQTIIHLNNPSPEEKIQILELKSQDTGLMLADFFTEEETVNIAKSSSIRNMLVSASALFESKTGKANFDNKNFSFEEKIESQIQDLKKEIETLKKYLNMNSPTLKEVTESECIQNFLNEKEAELLKKKEESNVYSETDDAGKLLFISNVFKGNYIIKTGRLKAGSKKIPDNVLIKGQKATIAVGFLHMGGTSLTSRLKNLLELCENNQDTDFYILRESSAPRISAKLASQILEKLNTLHNFKLIYIQPKERLNFDLIYEMIIAIHNKDIDHNPASALKTAKALFPSHFVFDILEYAGVYF